MNMTFDKVVMSFSKATDVFDTVVVVAYVLEASTATTVLFKAHACQNFITALG